MTLCLCLSLCLSQVGVLAKRPNESSWVLAWQSPSTYRFLAECCKRQLNQGSFVLLYFRLFTFSDLYWVRLSVFFCTVLFVSISQVIGCEDRLRNDLYCVECGVKLYSNQPTNQSFHLSHTVCKNIRVHPKLGTFLWDFFPNSGRRKFRHGISIGLSTKLIDGPACWPHLRRSTRRGCQKYITCCNSG